MNPQEIYAMPDVGRLLAFWKVHFEHVEREGPRLFGSRFLSVNFNDFCRMPAAVVAGVYETAGATPSEMDFRGIYSPPPPYAAKDVRWHQLIDKLGLPHLD